MATKAKLGRPVIARWDNTKPYDNGANRLPSMTDAAAWDRLLVRFTKWVNEGLEGAKARITEVQTQLAAATQRPSSILEWKTDDLHKAAATIDVFGDINERLETWKAQATDPEGWYNAPTAKRQISWIYRHVLDRLVTKTRFDPQFRVDGHGLQGLWHIVANACVVEKLKYSLDAMELMGQPYFSEF